MPFVKGIDVSVYDPVVNWNKVRAQGYRFAYIRSSYGVSNNQTMMDTMFQAHWAGAKAAGVLRGAYHYLRASQDGTKQAIEYLRIANPQAGDLPAALDLEEAFNQDATNAQFIKNAEAFLKKVEQETGIKPMVYSRASFLKEKVSQANGKAPAWAKDYRMWVAHWTYSYNENIKPIEAAGWAPYTFWQYSGEKEYLDGITNELGAPILVDFDVFKGTLEDLYKLAGGKAPDPLKYTIKSGDTFESIAKQFNVNLSELLNNNPHLVLVGTVLTVPQPAGAGFSSTGSGSTSTSGTGTTGGTTGGTTTSGSSSAAVVTLPTSYTVKPGDTLFFISQTFGVPIKAIADANNILDPNLIFVGQVLTIPKP